VDQIRCHGEFKEYSTSTYRAVSKARSEHELDQD
jgi:hypothetical protein